MSRPAAHRQRVKKAVVALLLLPLAALGAWLLFFSPGSDQRDQLPTVRTLVEGSSTLRGNIYDRNFDTLALSFRLSSIYARPLEITAPEETAAALARILGLKRDELLDSFLSERSFVWLTRQAEKEAVEQVLEGNFAGIHLLPRSYRYYPHREGAAHAVGFVKDEQGLAGIELAYDNVLRSGVADSRLKAVGFANQGDSGRLVHLVGTLDLQLQHDLEQQLRRALRTVDGRHGAGLVLDVRSGAVLAMVSLPAYDPNRYWAFSAEDRTNRAVTPQVRPGALGEIFRLAAALEQNPDQEWGSGAAAAESTVASEGNWQRLQPDILASPQLGRLAAYQTPQEVPKEFLQRLGLCGAAELDLLEAGGPPLAEVEPGKLLESTGDRAGDCLGLLTAAAEARVSGVALLAAVSRLVNGGRLVEPHLIQGFWDGESFRAAAPPTEGPFFSAGAGGRLLQLLTEEGGSGRNSLIFESMVALPAEVADFPEADFPEDARLPEEDLAPRLASEAPRYQAVLLGLSPARQPELALLLFVDQARWSPGMPSPLAAAARDLSSWREALRRPVVPPAALGLAQREATLYRQWLTSQGGSDFADSPSGGRMADLMPNVLGMSLRKALQALQATGLRFRVHGSGRVVAQHPAPGATLKGVDEGVIELRVYDRLAGRVGGEWSDEGRRPVTGGRPARLIDSGCLGRQADQAGDRRSQRRFPPSRSRDHFCRPDRGEG